MVASFPRRHFTLRPALLAGVLIAACCASCAHWPAVENEPLERIDLPASPLVLDAPEPDLIADTAVQETGIPQEIAHAEAETELGDPAPFPSLSDQLNRGTIERPASQQVISEAAAESTHWVEAGRSHEGRPIEAIHFRFGGNQEGPAAERVLFITSMAAGDPESVRFIDRFATRLSRVAADGSSDVAALLIRSPNPDGLAGHFSTNSRGVELNRNFPSSRFPVTRTTRTGPEPASELETQAMMQLLAEFQPTCIVHIRPGSGDTLLLLCQEDQQRATIERLTGRPVNVACHDGDFKAGSIEEYCRETWSTDIVTVYLPSVDSADSNESLRGVSLACLGFDLPQLDTEGADSLATYAASASQLHPGGEHGFVESLPPPEEHADGSHESRYYELPPPPE